MDRRTFIQSSAAALLAGVAAGPAIGKVRGASDRIALGFFGTGRMGRSNMRHQHENWLDCIGSRRRPICDVEIGHRSTVLPHLGNIAYRTASRLGWDSRHETCLDNAEANALLTREYHRPGASETAAYREGSARSRAPPRPAGRSGSIARKPTSSWRFQLKIDREG